MIGLGNRILKESTFTSDKISSLTDFEFRLWVGLILSADDAGRVDARPAIIKGQLFALRDRVSAKDIDASLHALAAKGCVSLYTVGGKPYLWFPSWARHQRIRNVRPKYPSPEDKDAFGQSAANCGKLPQIAADCGKLRPESNPIQSNSNTNSNTNPIEAYASCAEPEKSDSTPPIISLPLNDGTFFHVSQEQCQKWAGLYPAVDVIQQLRNMLGWLDSNPSKKKTRRGVQRFVTSWLAKEQDKGGNRAPRQANKSTSWEDLAAQIDWGDGT